MKPFNTPAQYALMTMKVTEGGTVMSFGKGAHGSLGLGSEKTSADLPSVIDVIGRANGNPVSSISCSTEHSAAITSKGQVYVWGYGKYGRLGLGDETDHFKPAYLSTMSGIASASIKCGELFTAILTNHGDCYTTGVIGTSAVGYTTDPGSYLVPRPVEHLSGVVIDCIGAGVTHMAAACAPNKIYVWGHSHEIDNSLGGKAEAQSDKMLIECLECGHNSKIVSLDCGVGHTVAMSSNGLVWTWGSGKSGELGNGTYMNVLVPTLIEPFEEGQVALAISAGGRSTVALTCKGDGGEWDLSGNTESKSSSVREEGAISGEAKERVDEITSLLNQLGTLNIEQPTAEDTSQGESKTTVEHASSANPDGPPPPSTQPPHTYEAPPPPSVKPSPPQAIEQASVPSMAAKGKKRRTLNKELNRVQAIALPPPPPPSAN